MLAADCSNLHPRLKHLVHVMALHADNVTGRGLTGQATLGRYMGLSGRQVRRLLHELEALWGAGRSPVGMLREKRWLNSDRYTVVVASGAPLQLSAGPRVVRTTVASHDRTTMSANDRTRLTNRADNRGRLTPNEADTVGLQTSEVSLQREPQRNPSGKNLPSADASGAPPHAPAGATPTEAQARSARRAAAARGYAKH